MTEPKNRVAKYMPDVAPRTLNAEDTLEAYCDVDEPVSWEGDLRVVLTPEEVFDLAQLKQKVEFQGQMLLAQQTDLSLLHQHLAQLAGAQSQSASYFEVSDSLEDVKRITSSIFAVPSAYVHGEDCEIAGERYIEVAVSDSGLIDDIVARQYEWHRQVSRLPSNVKRLFRLSVDVQSE